MADRYEKTWEGCSTGDIPRLRVVRCERCARYRRLLAQSEHRVAKLTAECDALIRRVKELEGQR